MLYRFGDFELDTGRFPLRRRAEILAVQRKTFQLLVHLLANAHRVVPREELLAVVWQSISVSEDALSQTVRQARRALGERAAREVIVTVRGIGYRVGVEVRLDDDAASLNDPS